MLLRPAHLTFDDLNVIHAAPPRLLIDPQALPAVLASAAVVQAAAAGAAPVYGVNTGFGKLASTRIGAADLAALQLNLIRSHSVGVGAPLSAPVMRLVLALKAASLARGHSGVRPVVIDTLLAVLNAGLVPFVPAQGSVGASGDLAPLAHLTLALLGEGEFIVEEGDGVDRGIDVPRSSAARGAAGAATGAAAAAAAAAAGSAQHAGAPPTSPMPPRLRRVPAADALLGAGIAPLMLSAKEGLALINGTQVSTALALHALFAFQPVLEAALVVGAMTLDAARGSDGPFDARIHALRGQPGQIDVAAHCRALMAGSAIRASHRADDDRVQDPYCLRCQPQVVGACLDQLRHAAAVLLREANAVTDNPLVFADDHGGGEIVSGGNFHAEPVALAADACAVAIAEVGAIAERRIAMLIDANVSRLPPFLTANAGLNSGFMIAHVTAAALASENKSLAHPASVDSLPTSANQEDHVSMATFAARRLQPMVRNVAHIVAIEWLAAAQGIDFLRPLISSPAIEAAHAALRAQCPALGDDRYLAPDIEHATALVLAGVPARVLHGLGAPPLWAAAS